MFSLFPVVRRKACEAADIILDRDMDDTIFVAYVCGRQSLLEYSNDMFLRRDIVDCLWSTVKGISLRT